MLFKQIKKISLLLLLAATGHAQQKLTLHYDKPAKEWTEALPVGNGRLGGMVFGRVNEELIQLNEATLWSGGPVSKNVNPDAFNNLAPTRQALTEGDYEKAYELTKKMQGLYSESYMPLGDLKIKQDFGNAQPTAYYRGLNIQDAVATTTFTVNGVEYKREVFASAPGECIIIRLTASKTKSLSLTVSAASQLNNIISAGHGLIMLKGKAPAHADPSYISYNKEPIIYTDTTGCRGMRFELIVKQQVKDGTAYTKNNEIVIKDATEVLLFVSAATSFNGFDKCPDSQGKDEHKLTLEHLKKSEGKKYEKLLKDHLADFHGFFNRVSLTLNDTEKDKSALPTDVRLEQYTAGGKDANLEALFFQYGRYLLISASRTKDAPANLQGIWSKELRAPWSSNYTTNINVQMNYWPVESGNLSELFSPLNDLIKNISVTGTETAKSFYHANGWVLHHNSDIWGTSNPVGDLGKGDPMWANWYMGANWLTRHLWEHYEYTGDKNYLKEVYPIMKGAALFTLDWLQQDKDGYLVTMPSTSPENRYYYDGKKKGAVTVASTMDMAIIRDLFSNTMAAAKILNTDNDFTKTLESANSKLLPYKIGSKGQLLEWYREFEEEDPHHRHTSHLYALHPATSISPLTTPDLANAARRTLELRGDDGTGWSLAWKVNMWARLLDGNHAYTLFRNQLRLTKDNDTNYNGHGGAYPNLFDAHPPFQIDGNFAGTAGVIEMLLQSQNNELHLLPALPDAWAEGNVTGLKAKGNFTVAIKWQNGKLAVGKITSNNGGKCSIRAAQPFIIKETGLKSEKSEIGYSVTFNSKKGTTYTVEATQ
ncbi:alpha-L-fucosidase [Flavobacterium akiainvivens]|uniref:Alpha-L-fucosidase n=1 Tax=Flavobacterium akiainvivens TaxID=1202724 RepID=A0A0M8M956_9FLAO|nr:glycoside hydrolase family 95 protein [Flavobacterium akiainvivens]KOS06113.1 alpha-L-fucosidase [Flavobacterium akiainvivens]SFQ55041.1 alpha-L-fucosidase 2 [Flavobacterium akiainvivens]